MLQLAYGVVDGQDSGIGDLAGNQSFVEFMDNVLATPLEKVIFEGGSAEAGREQERQIDRPGVITVFLAAFEVVTAETAGLTRRLIRRRLSGPFRSRSSSVSLKWLAQPEVTTAGQILGSAYVRN